MLCYTSVRVSCGVKTFVANQGITPYLPPVRLTGAGDHDAHFARRSAQNDDVALSRKERDLKFTSFFLPREGGVADYALHPGMMALEHSALSFLSGSSIGRKQLASFSYGYVQDKSKNHV